MTLSQHRFFYLLRLVDTNLQLFIDVDIHYMRLSFYYERLMGESTCQHLYRNG